VSDATIASTDILAAGVVHVRACAAGPADIAGLGRQLGRERPPADSRPDITIRFVHRLPRQGLQHVEVGRSAFTSEGYMVRAAGRGGWCIVPFANAGAPCEFVCERGVRSVPLLGAFIRLAAIGRGFLPFHASAFEWQGRGVLVAGWSHGGKTSALLSFAANGARYVGDDLVLIAQDGSEMRGLNVPIAVSEWHLSQLPHVQRTTPMRTRLWHAAVERVSRAAEAQDVRGGNGIAGSLRLRTVSRVARRSTKLVVPLHTLFAAGTAACATPRTLFLMLSTQQDQVTVEPMPAREIADRMAHSLAAEALPLLDHYHAYRFAGIGPRSDLLDTLAEREGALLRSALAGLDGYVVRHPYPAPFAGLFEAMQPACESPTVSRS
jgi:hypothetical protein